MGSDEGTMTDIIRPDERFSLEPKGQGNHGPV